MGHVVKTSLFEGPFELLLSLVEERKLFINDISLSNVTEEYLARVRAMPEDVENSSLFIATAATLILLKSRSLLPNVTLSSEEEEDVSTLARRLAAFKVIQEISKGLLAQYGINVIYRAPALKTDPVFAPGPLTVAGINESANSVLSRVPKKEFLPEARVEKTIRLEDVLTNLAERLEKEVQMTFRAFTGGEKREKTYTIISFLALLELVRDGKADVEQNAREEDITITFNKQPV